MGNVGTRLLFQDERIAIREFVLEPGEHTPVHTHDCDYVFHILERSRLETLAADGASLFAFNAPTGESFAFRCESADLGFRRPERWGVVPLQVAGILVAFIVGETVAALLISSFVSLPAPDLSRYDAIAGNLGAAVAFALILPLTASIPEEIFYRGS